MGNGHLVGVRLLFLVCLLDAIGIAWLDAQDSEISGEILDSSLSAVPGARVTLNRLETGGHWESVSNDKGYYLFPLLLPGRYELKAEKTGFQTRIQTGIVVETASVSSVNVTLTVGAITQSVTVQASVPLLQAQSSGVAHVVGNDVIAHLPLLDRRSAQLTRLNGFVVPNSAGSGATFAIAGGRGNNANYYVDGGTVQNLTLGLPTLVFDPPVEAMQEFNVALSAYPAELGRSGGGVVQITTKSGTNQFHGSAYEFFRNDVLNARTFFSTSNPALRYNLFGMSLGGPIRRDKTHFFFNYEGKREHTVKTVILNVPTVEETRGDFAADPSKIIDPSACSGTTPPVCKPFPGNIIPSGRMDPVGAKLAAFYPAPTVSGAPSGKANFRADDPTDTPSDVYVGRIDHSFNGQNRIFARLLAQTPSTRVASVFPTPGTDSLGLGFSYSYYNVSAAWDHTFSPTALNEIQYAYTRNSYVGMSAGAHTTLDEQIGLTGVNEAFFPAVTVQGYAQLGSAAQQRLQTPIRSDQYTDRLTLIRGTHQLRFGFEYRYASNIDRNSPTAGGAFSFTNAITNSSVASLLLGRVVRASRLEQDPLHSRSDSYAGYAQDDWRVTPKLTLNLGLRWESDAPRWETSNQQNSFDPVALNPVSHTPGIVLFSGRSGLSKYASNWDLDNFGPRLGFAWTPREQCVVRGGGAILYTGQYDSATPIDAGLGFAISGSFASPDNGVTPAFLLASGLPPVSHPAAQDLTPGFGAVPVGAMPTTSVTFFERSRQTGYLYQASLDLQRQFGGNWLLDIGYLGTFGHHLASPDPRGIDQVPPDEMGPGNAQVRRPFLQYTNVQVLAADIGNSNYDALNIGLEKRYSAGLSLLANYTYSQFIDNLDARNELAAYPGTNAFTDYYNQASNKGRSGNDITHRFVLSSVYDLPVGPGRHYALSSGVANAIAGGWTLGLIAEARTGTPLSPLELTNTTNSFSDGLRPNVVGYPALPGSRPLAQKLLEWFNTNAFAAPAPYTFGNAGRTFGEGPGAVSMDASLLKEFSIWEKATLQFRAEVLNFLNHPNFANPDTRRGAATFGQITSLALGNQARIIQLGLHLMF